MKSKLNVCPINKICLIWSILTVFSFVLIPIYVHFRFQILLNQRKTNELRYYHTYIRQILYVSTYSLEYLDKPRHHTQPQNTPHNFRKTPTPWSPPPAGFQRLQFNRWVRSPYVGRSISIAATRRCNFLRETNVFFILLTIILYAADQRAWGQKVCFLVNTCAFYSSVARINSHWPQLSADIFFTDAAWGLIMFWHDFGRGGGRHCHGCRWRRGGRVW